MLPALAAILHVWLWLRKIPDFVLDTFFVGSPRRLSAAIFPSVKPYEPPALGVASTVQCGAQPASKTLTAHSTPYNRRSAHAWHIRDTPAEESDTSQQRQRHLFRTTSAKTCSKICTEDCTIRAPKLLSPA
jgi:hypothetical protein